MSRSDLNGVGQLFVDASLYLTSACEYNCTLYRSYFQSPPSGQQHITFKFGGRKS